MRLYKIILVFVFCLCQHVIVAQDYKKDFKKINESIFLKRNYNVDIAYKMYTEEKNIIASQQRTLTVTRDNSNMRFKQGEVMERIFNTSNEIIIDNTYKIITVANRPKEELSEAEITNLIFDNLDSIISIYKKINYKKLNSQFASYECFLEETQYEKIIYEFNPSTFLLSKIKLYVREPQFNVRNDNKSYKIMVEMSFQNISFQPITDKTIFSSSKFFTKNAKGEIILTKKYSKYELTNLLTADL